jgi:hypothetical protein
MLFRVAVLSACVLGGGLLGAGAAIAEDLGPEQARAFVIGKLFSYTCFEGTAGVGRVFSDGSVVGTIRIRGQGQTRFAALPAGTLRVEGESMCAHLNGLPITPCFRVQKLDSRSFRGSISGLGFAYCDFYQRNPRTQLISGASDDPADMTPVATSVASSIATPRPVAAPAETARPVVTPVANTRPVLRPSLAE